MTEEEEEEEEERADNYLICYWAKVMGFSITHKNIVFS